MHHVMEYIIIHEPEHFSYIKLKVPRVHFMVVRIGPAPFLARGHKRYTKPGHSLFC